MNIGLASPFGIVVCMFFSDQTVVTISTGSGYIPRHTQWHTWFRHRDSFYLHHTDDDIGDTAAKKCLSSVERVNSSS